MNTLKFSINPRQIDVHLDILEFVPTPKVLGQGDWSLFPEIYGCPDNDGITNFEAALLKASRLSKEEGRELLFPKQPQIIKRDDVYVVLPDRALVDPDLSWSLYSQPNQVILRYLHGDYDITSFLALRRVVVNGFGRKFSLILKRTIDGSWQYDREMFAPKTAEAYPALCLG